MMNKTIILFFVAFIIGAIVASPETDNVKKILEAVRDDETNSTNTIDDRIDSTTVDGQTSTTTVGIDDNNMGCNLCLRFVEGLETMSATEEGNVDEKANFVCDILTIGDEWKYEICKEIIDEFLNEIVNAIKNSETPQAICTDIVGMCNA
uniref:Saposin B-type domain-containing protein n=1 Tax=Panagrolaimus davidi TaxID=227884 RepID=A0A914PQU4_9BILA